MTQVTSAFALLVAALAVLSVSAPLSVRAQGTGTQITISQPAEATTMDPGRSTQVLTVNYFFNLYDTLTRWDTGLKLVPGLATSWKSVNDTTWEFALRPGVKFHDGAPLTAEDVKATIERNTIPGRTIVHSGFATIEAVEVVNPGTIRVITKKPDPLVPVRMAQMGAQILPARFTTEAGAKDLAKKPIGSGAYRFVEWVKDERLVMEANRDWWGWEGKAPSFDRRDLEAHPRGLPRIVALDKGEVDIITNVPPDQVKAIESGRLTRVVTTPATRFVAFNMNSTQPPLSDKRVRQALHYALDVNAIVKNLFGGQGKPFSGGLADTDFGYNAALKPYPYDRGAGAPAPGGCRVRQWHRRDAARRHGHHGQRQAPRRGHRRHVGESGHSRQGADDGDGRAPAHAQRPHDPAQRAAARQPAVDPARRRRIALAHLSSERARREVLDGQPARPALPRPDGAGALYPRRGEAEAALHRGDPDRERGEALARALPGGHRLRHVPARELPAAGGFSADRLGDDAGAMRPMRAAGVAAGRDRRGGASRAGARRGGGQVPPGFRVQAYVTGQGFDSSQERRARGVPSVATLTFDPAGVLYLGRSGRRYMSGGEVEDLWRLYRIPAGGASMTPSTEARFLFGPPLSNPQVGVFRGERELFVTTYDRDRKIGVLYRMVDGRAELFAGGTPEAGAPPDLRQPEGIAVDASGASTWRTGPPVRWCGSMHAGAWSPGATRR